MSEIENRVCKLRNAMKESGLDGYIITGKDPHMGEYSPLCWRYREFITGFTGSNGMVLVTMDDGVLWTDSRYFIQAAKELEGTPFEMLREQTDDPDVVSYIKVNMEKGSRIGVDSQSISVHSLGVLSSMLDSYEIVPTGDLVSPFWSDRPGLPDGKVELLPLSVTGESIDEKIGRIREMMDTDGVSWTLISDLDDIAWTLNIRSSDIPYDPVFLSYLLITKSDAVLFASPDRLKGVDLPILVESFDLMEDVLSKKAVGKGALNFKKTAVSNFKKIRNHDVIDLNNDYPTSLKCIKNKTEIEGMKKAHVEDALSFVNFLARLEKSGASDEMEVLAMLEEERKKCPDYLSPSFGGIAGFGPNGAMCHYAPDENAYSPIDTSGLLVLDTGGQYKTGTTDITRTLLFGKAEEKWKRAYTLVLKGHLALSNQVFPSSARGCHLDVLAKQFLWNECLDFFHGTGHGVGMRLNVHEAPVRISPALIDVKLEEGMVVSDEPGLYVEGEFGIRIENLVYVKKEKETLFGSFLSFGTLTLVPYERKLIDTSLLTKDEIKAIDSYHEMVYETLSDKLDERGRKYLEKATKPLLY